MRQIYKIILGMSIAVCSPILFSCSGDVLHLAEKSEGHSFVLSYTIPNNEDSCYLSRAIPSTIPSANENENKVEKLNLLFFEQDDYGNGLFVGMLDASLEGGSIKTSNNVNFSMGSIADDRDYDVLIIANAHKYFNNVTLQSLCNGMTENRAKLMCGQMPSSGSDYIIPDNLFMMSATTTKKKGENITVDLIRAIVRIDVKVATEKDYILGQATLRNSSDRIPLFSSPVDIKFNSLSYKTITSSNNMIIGGLYLPETYRSGLNNSSLKHRQSACVILNCKANGYTKNWYRVDINLGVDGKQYLKRNNVYTVVITNIKGEGKETIEEAYFDDVTSISAITVPTTWDVPVGTRPTIEIH